MNNITQQGLNAHKKTPRPLSPKAQGINMKPLTGNFLKDWGVRPGETIEETRISYNKTEEEFALALNITLEQYKELVWGGVIDDDMANKLSKLLRTSKYFWLNLEADYRDWVNNLFNKCIIGTYQFVDGKYEVDGDVNLSDRGLWEIPVRFKYVSGNFNISKNYIESLYGCPEYVDGNFDCSSNYLVNLKYFPLIIKGNVNISGNFSYVATE